MHPFYRSFTRRRSGARTPGHRMLKKLPFCHLRLLRVRELLRNRRKHRLSFRRRRSGAVWRTPLGPAAAKRPSSPRPIAQSCLAAAVRGSHAPAFSALELAVASAVFMHCLCGTVRRDGTRCAREVGQGHTGALLVVLDSRHLFFVFFLLFRSFDFFLFIWQYILLIVRLCEKSIGKGGKR
jgi:hypothetical protein